MRLEEVEEELEALREPDFRLFPPARRRDGVGSGAGVSTVDGGRFSSIVRDFRETNEMKMKLLKFKCFLFSNST